MLFSRNSKMNDIKIQVEKQRSEYENALFGQKERIFSMREENQKLLEELEQYKKKDKQIASALLLAMQKAKEIEDNAKLAASLEMKRLTEFHKKWARYYEDIKKLFPQDSGVVAAGEFLKKMESVLTSGLDKNTYSEDEESLRRQHESERARINSRISRESDAVAAVEHSATQPEKAPETKTQSPKEIFEKKLLEMKNYLDKQKEDFSMEEVLNPKNLASLDELCEEMGLK